MEKITIPCYEPYVVTEYIEEEKEGPNGITIKVNRPHHSIRYNEVKKEVYEYELYASNIQKPEYNPLDVYYVTAKNHEDLDSIYHDLETEGKSPPGLNITRAVECVERQPTSRNTFYKLTQEEANLLKNDTRIVGVWWKTPGIQVKSTVNMIGNFDKTESFETYFANTAYPNDPTSTIPIGFVNNTVDPPIVGHGSPNNKRYMINWGLLRGTLESQNVYPEWGGAGGHTAGTSGGGANTNPNIITSIELTQTGKNVDLVVVDMSSIPADHPEWIRNSDENTIVTTGNTYPQGTNRLNYYNWWKHNPVVTGGPESTYPNLDNFKYWGDSEMPGHPMHCMSISGGTTQGWAKDANLYHLFINSNLPFDYLREFHKNKSINPVTKRKNPTITTNSYGYFMDYNTRGYPWVTKMYWRGQTVTGPVYDGALFDKTFIGVTTGYFWKTEQYWRIFRENPLDKLFGENGTDVPAVEHTVFDLLSTPYTTSWLGAEMDIGNGHTLTEQVIRDDDDDEFGNRQSINQMLTQPADLQTLTMSTTPTYGTNDDGYWELNVPFTFRFGAGIPGDTPVTNLNKFLHNKVYVNTNQTITFVQPSLDKEFVWGNNLTANGVPLSSGDAISNFIPTSYATTFAGIGWCAGKRRPETNTPGENLNHSIQKIYYGVKGTAPNRIFIIRVEGDYYHEAGQNGSGKIGEYQIFERDWVNYDYSVIDGAVRYRTMRVIWGKNNSKWRNGDFVGKIPRRYYDNTGFNTPSIVNGIPVPYTSQTADLEDLLKQGLTFVCAAGNSGKPITKRGDLDFNNWFMNEQHYDYADVNPNSNNIPANYFDEYYSHRGNFPAVIDSKSSGGTYDLDPIVVGAVDNSSNEYLHPMLIFSYEATAKELNYSAHQLLMEIPEEVTFKQVRHAEDAQEYRARYSNYGAGVDIWAPGTMIASAYHQGKVDPRSKTKIWLQSKISGTSMACPQVAGVLACALETYPYWSQKECKEYILSYAKTNKLHDTYGYTDWRYQDEFQLGSWSTWAPGYTNEYNTWEGETQDLTSYYANDIGTAGNWYRNLVTGVLPGNYYKVNNNYFYYYKERKTTGTVFPKVNVKVRPTEGAVFPRPRIRRSA